MGCKIQPNIQIRNSCSLQLKSQDCEFMLIKQHTLGGLEKHLPPLKHCPDSAQRWSTLSTLAAVACCRARLLGCCPWPGHAGTAPRTSVDQAGPAEPVHARASGSAGVCARPRRGRSALLLLHTLLSPPQQHSWGRAVNN